MDTPTRRVTSLLDWPLGFRPLLAIGRTTPWQPRVSEEDLAALESRYDRYPRKPRMGPMSVSQRLDLVATSLLATAMEDIKGHHAKRDILTVWKAKNRWDREIPVPNPDIFSGHDPFVDRAMIDMTFDHHASEEPIVLQEYLDLLSGAVR